MASISLTKPDSRCRTSSASDRGRQRTGSRKSGKVRFHEPVVSAQTLPYDDDTFMSATDDADALIGRLESCDLTDQETDQLLNQAYELNKRLKDELVNGDMQASSSGYQGPFGEMSVNASNDDRYMLHSPGPSDMERLQSRDSLQSRNSLSGSLPPIVGSTSGLNSAKVYGSRRPYQHSPSSSVPVYHARLQFNSPDMLSSRPPSQACPEQPVRETTSLWLQNSNPQWTDKFAYT